MPSIKKDNSAPARLLIGLAVLALVQLACTVGSIAASATPGPPATISTPGSLPPTIGVTSTIALPTSPATWTASPTLAVTASPLPSATIDPSATPTRIAWATPPPTTWPNRLENAGFEGAWRHVIFAEVKVGKDWEPYYCDEPYTAEKCPAPRQGTGNPEGLLMGRPEFLITELPKRVHSGERAQQWFCFWRSCRAGIYQTFTTQAGEICEVGAWVQAWSSNGTGFTSDLQTGDQQSNASFLIRVDPEGGTDAFAPGLILSRVFGYDDHIYDRYAAISLIFEATGPQTTVFFENLRLWPIANNDSYLDDAYARCY